jgi:2-polyprenyl-3-methyl-5-hydroxy-6-metoxy-1,4-benzoquinol methylase
MKSEFEHTQEHELSSWVCDDPVIRSDKALREAIRYPLLKRQMGLDHLPTKDMEIWDIGCGAAGGVSTILKGKKIVRFDPLAAEYAKYYPLTSYETTKAEDLKERLATPDLIIVTNAMDHFDNPAIFAQDIAQYMKPGAFFAHLHAINNAYSHPHDAHAHNINPEMFEEYLDTDFEQVWGLDYQHDGLVYGWRKQPAFSGLYRKVTGYQK